MGNLNVDNLMGRKECRSTGVLLNLTLGFPSLSESFTFAFREKKKNKSLSSVHALHISIN